MIQFTQFKRPNGRKELVNINRPGEIEVKAIEIHEAGYRFEIEEKASQWLSEIRKVLTK